MRSFIGRERELELFGRALVQLDCGHVQMMYVTGEPGIGKTRLLAQFAESARNRERLVLVGRACESGRPALGSLTTALDGHIAHLPADVKPLGAQSNRLQLLSAVFPALSSSASPSARVERNQLRDAMLELLESLAEAGLVLLLDDMHWADEDTLAVLEQLLDCPGVPAILVLAYRKRQVSPALRALIAAAARRSADGQIELGPLSKGEAHLLLGAHGSDAWHHAVYERSGGNPLYLKALAHSTLPRGPSGELTVNGLPPAVEAALLLELDRLTPEVELVAHAAAIFVEPFDAALVAEICDLSEAKVFAAIDEMFDHDLVRPVTAATPRFEFRHLVVRQVFYQSSHPRWRFAAHARAARALARRGVPVTTQAYHVARAALHDHDAAVTLLNEAATALRFQAPATAAEWLETALNLLRREEQGFERAKLMLHLAVNLGAAGNLKKCRDILHDMLHLLPLDQVRLRAEAVAWCALVDRYLCLPAEGHALLTKELPRLSSQDSLEAAELMFQLACIELIDGSVAECSRLAAHIVVIASELNDQPLECAGYGLAAVSEFLEQNVPLATTHLSKATHILDGLLDSELVQWLEVTVWVGWSALFLDQPDEALRHLDRGLALARARGQHIVVPGLLIGRAVALRAGGRLDEAGHCAEEAAELAELIGCGEQYAAALAVKCLTLTAAGRLDEALHIGGLAVGHRTVGRSGRISWLAALPARALAEARLAAGDHDGCIALAATVGGKSMLGADPWSQIAWYEMLTRAAVQGRCLDAAAEWADRAGVMARFLGLPGPTGLAKLAEAHLALVSASVQAVEPAMAAASALSTASLTIDVLRARLAIGRALASNGQVDDAAAEMIAIESAAKACGAFHLADLAVTERDRLAPKLSRVGAKEHDARIAALTPRQKQIAAMVADGLTNRQIARNLCVTEKTVEMHLSKIFTKLEVSTRTAVASVIIRSLA